MADDDGNNQIRVVPLGEQNIFRGQVEEFARKLPDMMECAKLNAKLRRAAYLAYIAEGFAEAQALELCKA